MEYFKCIEFSRKHPEFQSVYWVCSALAKYADMRKHVKNIKVEKSTMTATDGNRLHHYKSDIGIKDGFYSVVKLAKKHIVLRFEGTDIDYPNISDLIAPNKESEIVRVYQDGGNCYTAFSKISRLLPENETLNYKYLLDLIGSDFFDAHVYRDDKSSIILFLNNSKTGVLMPMRASC